MEAKDVGGELKVGPIRDLRSDAFIRPNEARSKVYLIENAQNMNPNAQNALLKVLEEGPPYAAFLLMTDRAGALLETVPGAPPFTSARTTTATRRMRRRWPLPSCWSAATNFSARIFWFALKIRSRIARRRSTF